MSDFDDVLEGNARHAAAFTGADVPGRAARGLAVVTCMDSRIDPLAALGLRVGDVKVLRTAGGRVTDDVLRWLVLAVHALGVRRVLVMPHTDCGMAKNTEQGVRQVVREATGVDAGSLEFGTIADPAAQLAHDVARVRALPWLPSDTAVLGAFYDVRTGRLQTTDA